MEDLTGLVKLANPELLNKHPIPEIICFWAAEFVAEFTQPFALQATFVLRFGD